MPSATKDTFFILNIKVYNNKVTYDITYELLYNTTNTVPGGAIDHDSPLAFNMDLKIQLIIKYKVLNIKKNKDFFTNKYLCWFHTGC